MLPFEQFTVTALLDIRLLTNFTWIRLVSQRIRRIEFKFRFTHVSELLAISLIIMTHSAPCCFVSGFGPTVPVTLSSYVLIFKWDPMECKQMYWCGYHGNAILGDDTTHKIERGGGGPVFWHLLNNPMLFLLQLANQSTIKIYRKC